LEFSNTRPGAYQANLSLFAESVGPLPAFAKTISECRSSTGKETVERRAAASPQTKISTRTSGTLAIRVEINGLPKATGLPIASDEPAGGLKVPRSRPSTPTRNSAATDHDSGTTPPSFAELLRRYRVAAGFSQGYLAERAGVSIESIGALERGARRSPYRHTIAVLSAALDLSSEARTDFEAAAQASRAGHRGEAIPSGAWALSKPPVYSTSFVGRAADLVAIKNLLHANRLVTITGSGGVGKTRAVVELVASLPPSGEHWDDIRFVDLTPHAEEPSVTNAIALAVGRPLSGVAASIESLVATLQTRRSLIVIDNCEHVIDRVALIVSSLLSTCPQLTFLATSRERLALGGEMVYRLPSLDLADDATSSVVEARKHAALDLFMQRVTSIDPGCVFTGERPGILAAICRRLDGIPLAIELVAAHVPAIGLEPLLTLLPQDLASLSRARDLPARQQTMLATIAWSYRLLNDGERKLLGRLSIFSGSFRLEAVEAACSGRGLEPEAVADVLASLVDKCLVNVKAQLNPPRYTMLESVRAFAFERLSESESVDSLSLRRATWLAEFAERFDDARWHMPAGWQRTQADPEFDNANAAIAWAFRSEAPQDALLGARIVGGFRTVWLATGQRAEFKRLALRAIEVVDPNAHPRIAARLLRGLVQATSGNERRFWLDRTLPFLERIGDDIGLAGIHTQVAIDHHRYGNLTEADRQIRRAAEYVARLANEPLAEAYYLRHRVYIRIEQQRFDDALADVDRGASLARSLGDREALVWSLLRSEVTLATGLLDQSRHLAILALESALERPAGRNHEIVHAHCLLAHLDAALGDLEGAYAAGREALLRSAVDRGYYHFDRAIEVAATLAALRGAPEIAAKLIGYLDAWDHQGIESPWMVGAARMRNLLATIARSISASAIEVLRTEGARLTADAALGEALRV
jgi:predicted ATPase/transcriptional regulator with XRE-family HTH domain